MSRFTSNANIQSQIQEVVFPICSTAESKGVEVVDQSLCPTTDLQLMFIFLLPVTTTFP